jgi:hypothetical protein
MTETVTRRLRLITSEYFLRSLEIGLMSSAHVNIGVDASEKNDGWVSIAGKARYALLPLPLEHS